MAHVLFVIILLAVAALLIAAALETQGKKATHRPSPSRPNTAPAAIDASAIAQRAGRGVVSVTAVRPADGTTVSASGIVLTPGGEVLTSNHVIASARSITAGVAGGATFAAHVMGYDTADDLALLQLEGASGLQPLTPATSTLVPAGTPLVAIGNELGLGGAPAARAVTVAALDQTATTGIATDPASNATVRGLIALTPAIGAGDSGGPLVDTGAHAVGMITAAVGANSSFGYALPMPRALAIVSEITTGSGGPGVRVGPRAVLGIATTPTAGGAYGALVGSVTGDAARAGLRAGDVVVSIDDATIASPADIDAALDHHRPGDAVMVGWLDRADMFRSARVQLTSGPAA